eukprot:6631479-Prorocentrum_lima.AAC.1
MCFLAVAWGRLPGRPCRRRRVQLGWRCMASGALVGAAGCAQTARVQSSPGCAQRVLLRGCRAWL